VSRGSAARAPAGLLVLLFAWQLTGGPEAQDVQKRRGFSIKITQPVSGDMVIGKTRIVADVKADRPEQIEAVEFYVGDEMIFRDTEPPYECSYDFGPQALARVIRAVARHREGVTVSDVVVTRKIDFSFAVRVNRVELNAAVEDNDGHFVTGLGKDDLTVLEEGKPRKIIDFSLETRPLSVALLVDTSGSMQEKIATAQKAASGFVDSLHESDRAMVIDFADKVYLLEDLSADHKGLRKAIESTTAVGGTAIYDAVHATLRKMRPVEGRKVIVLLSDGGDSTSQFTRDKVIEEAKAGDVTIYSIGLGPGFEAGAKGLLKNFAEATGGRTLFASDQSELVENYSKVMDDLRNQYYLTYQSPNDVFDGRWVPIEVQCKRAGTSVRARKGYFAVRTVS